MSKSRYTIEWLLCFAAHHTKSIPLEIKPHLHRLLDAPPEFDNCPLTRTVTAELVSLTPATLAVKATIGCYALPLIRSGRNVRYRLKDVRNYLNSNRYSF